MDYLMRLDQRYGGMEIIRARQIIHRFYRNSKDNNPNTPEIIHWDKIGEEIDLLSRSPDLNLKKNMFIF